MASRLHRKISSYNIHTGVEFNSSYALPPTQTGTSTYSTDWTFSGVTTPVFESTEGPTGGAGSWRFKSGPTSGANRVRNTSTGMMAELYDKDFCTGFWVKMTTLPPAGYGTPLVTFQSTATTGFSIYPQTDAYGVTKWEFSGPFGTSNSGITVSTGVWYFLAMRRDGSNWTFYVNGQSVGTATYAGSNTNGASLNFGQISQGYEIESNLSNWFITGSADVTAADLLEIYNVGSSNRVVKHWDGDSWEESYDQKVYNGTSWVQWPTPTRWNGSSWVAI